MKFEPGDRVIIFDTARTVYAGHTVIATVVELIDDRLYIMIDGDTRTVNGNVRRFRKLTKLDEALK